MPSISLGSRAVALMGQNVALGCESAAHLLGHASVSVLAVPIGPIYGQLARDWQALGRAWIDATAVRA